MYNAITPNIFGTCHKHIWKGNIPPKVKIFVWLMENNAILTKDILIRRGWVADPKCSFYDNNKSISHPFFECPVTKVIWGIITTCTGPKQTM